MNKSNALQSFFLKSIFQADFTAIAGLAQNAGAPLTSLFMGLYTAPPLNSGSQTSNEVSTGAYSTYVRQAVARTAGGFTVSGTSPTQVTNAALIQFPNPTAPGDAATIPYWGLGTLLAGAGALLYSGPIGTSLGIGEGSTTGNLITIPGLAGLAINDRVALVAIQQSTLPGGLAEGVTYFVKTLSGDQITLSLTSGGAVITISADGICYLVKATPLAIAQNVQPQINPGTLIITEA